MKAILTACIALAGLPVATTPVSAEVSGSWRLPA